MFRRLISILLSFMFLLFLTAPTVIMFIDDTTDVSIFYTANDEEEKKGQEKDMDKELLYHDFLKTASSFYSNDKENNQEYFFKNYPDPHLNLISPPPDFNIL